MIDKKKTDKNFWMIISHLESTYLITTFLNTKLGENDIISDDFLFCTICGELDP